VISAARAVWDINAAPKSAAIPILKNPVIASPFAFKDPELDRKHIEFARQCRGARYVGGVL
jgi:hypothetical protein